ncbi:MAG: ABC transporter ATP-binding protein [Thermotogota bacterium]
MILLHDFSKSYSKGTFAVKNINLEIKDGEVFGFLGPNGAGKSTTIKSIVGLLNPTNGKIEVNGYDISKESVQAKYQIGYVPDEAVLMEKLKGIEYLNFIADMYQVNNQQRRERMSRLSEAFKLTSALNKTIDTYSHGMKQKLSLIAALIHNPPVWILDEPIVGLDPESAYRLKKMMKSHSQKGKTVFFSTHVMEIVEKVCDRVAIISKGEIVFAGTVEALKKNRGDSTMEEVFLEVTKSEAEQDDFSYLDSY